MNIKKLIMKIIKNNRLLLIIFTPILKFKHFVFNYYFRNKRFKKNGEVVLLEAKKALDTIDLRFWLDFGTLLGVYRDGKLLSKDLDIDLGVFLKDYSPKIEEAMQRQGFKLISEYEIDNKEYGFEQTYELMGVTVDLFYYSYDNDKMWSHLFVNYPNLTNEESVFIKGGLLPIEQYFPKCNFTEIKFLNNLFVIPKNSDEYLSFHYGEDYKIPRKWNYWDLENDNKNARFLYNKVGIYKLYR